jgi:hypothetical protein
MEFWNQSQDEQIAELLKENQEMRLFIETAHEFMHDDKFRALGEVVKLRTIMSMIHSNARTALHTMQGYGDALLSIRDLSYEALETDSVMEHSTAAPTAPRGQVGAGE